MTTTTTTTIPVVLMTARVEAVMESLIQSVVESLDADNNIQQQQQQPNPVVVSTVDESGREGNNNNNKDDDDDDIIIPHLVQRLLLGWSTRPAPPHADDNDDRNRIVVVVVSCVLQSYSKYLRPPSQQLVGHHHHHHHHHHDPEERYQLLLLLTRYELLIASLMRLLATSSSSTATLTLVSSREHDSDTVTTTTTAPEDTATTTTTPVVPSLLLLLRQTLLPLLQDVSGRSISSSSDIHSAGGPPHHHHQQEILRLRLIHSTLDVLLLQQQLPWTTTSPEVLSLLRSSMCWWWGYTTTTTTTTIHPPHVSLLTEYLLFQHSNNTDDDMPCLDDDYDDAHGTTIGDILRYIIRETDTTTTTHHDFLFHGTTINNNNNNNNNESGPAIPAVIRSIWERWWQLVLTMTTVGRQGGNDDDDRDHDPTTITSAIALSSTLEATSTLPEQIPFRIIELLQFDKMVQCLHSYYFLDIPEGCLNNDDNVSHPSQSSPSSQQQPHKLHLGRLISAPLSASSKATSNHTTINDATIANSERMMHRDQCIRTLMQFVLYLIVVEPPAIDNATVELMFSMLYTLLNSSKEKEVRVGLVLVRHVLSYLFQRWTPTTTSVILPIVDNLQVILQHLLKICRIGSTLWMIGYTQRIVFQFRIGVSNGNDESVTKMIYKVIQEWLHIIDRNNRHYTQNHLIFGLLMGISPILYDEASRMRRHCETNDNKNFTLPHGIEIGRLGLSSFLPILNGESGYDEIFTKGIRDDIDVDLMTDFDPTASPKRNDSERLAQKMMIRRMSGLVQLRTLGALSNLLLLAHPIIFRHSGKILCALIAYIRRLDDVVQSDPGATSSPDHSDDDESSSHVRQSIRRQAIHVAALAMVVGGETATDVANKIIGCDNFDSGVVSIVETIRLRAATLVQ